MRLPESITFSAENAMACTVLKSPDRARSLIREKNMNRIAIVLALAITGLSTGCGAAVQGRTFASGQVTQIAQQDTGGVVELTGPIVQATEDAHLAMTEHCGGRWRRLGGADAVAMRDEGAAVKSGADEESSWSMEDDRLIAYECISRPGR